MRAPAVKSSVYAAPHTQKPVTASASASTKSSSAAAEDDEVEIAMQMAMLAAKNPKMSPDELRKRVNEANQKQARFNNQVDKKKEEKQQKKASGWGWFTAKAEAVIEKAMDVRDAFDDKVVEVKEVAEKKIYQKKIRNDPEYRDLKVRCHILRNAVRSARLETSRAQTRHDFRRQKKESELVDIRRQLKAQKLLFTADDYNVHYYAKAMMRAEKHRKVQGTKEALVLEAQLCRHMHQMLAFDQQMAKTKKQCNELVVFITKCRDWISNRIASCAEGKVAVKDSLTSMKSSYEDMIKLQDKKIVKFKKLKEFRRVDLTKVDLPQWNQLNDTTLGPKPILCVLRGQPLDVPRSPVKPEKEDEPAPELVIDADDDDASSVESAISDPVPEDNYVPTADELEGSSEDFADAPWEGDKEEEANELAKMKQVSSTKEDGSTSTPTQ